MRPQLSLGRYQDRFDEELRRAGTQSYVDRIWARDPSLWKDEPEHAKIISRSLGWLTVAQGMKSRVDEIGQFTEEVRRRKLTTACLLGMGGSSLCPEVCALTFGNGPGYPTLVVLDTTDPASIHAAEKQMDLAHTLFLVSSKSGGTIESSSLQKYFYEKVRALKGNSAGENFVAITDPGTALEQLAGELSFLRVFLNPSDIGGRYSALSFFGLVPMALLGLDLAAVLERAGRIARQCRATDPEANPGLSLGVALGTLAREGRDKATFVLAPEIAAFGYWVEQLVAESTGKDGVGIVPVEGEPLGQPAVYQHDRVFIQIDVAGKVDPAVHTRLRALEEAGHPVLRWELSDTMDLAGEVFLWEFATAVAGAVMGIDPFDQPNVQESKDNTRRLIQKYEQTGEIEDGRPAVTESILSLYGPPQIAAGKSLRDALDAFLGTAGPNDYVALLAYVRRSADVTASLQAMRNAIRDNTRRATTLGFGPRFLHSTGQLHKGGANTGLFIQVTAADADDIPIPGEKYSFGVLKKAQSSGDLQALAEHGCRAVRVHIAGHLREGLGLLGQAFKQDPR